MLPPTGQLCFFFFQSLVAETTTFCFYHRSQCHEDVAQGRDSCACTMLLLVHTLQTKGSIQGAASLTLSTHVSSAHSSRGAAGEAAASLQISVTSASHLNKLNRATSALFFFFSYITQRSYCNPAGLFKTGFSEGGTIG